MTRGRYFATVMPIWSILYVIGLIAFHNGTFAVIGALVFPLLGVIGNALIRPCARPGATDGAAVDAGPVPAGRFRASRAERRAARRGY